MDKVKKYSIIFSKGSVMVIMLQEQSWRFIFINIDKLQTERFRRHLGGILVLEGKVCVIDLSE